jgi:hypothetical protein
MSNALEALKNEDFSMLGAIKVTPQDLHATLQASKTVLSVREAIMDGEIDDNDVVLFVAPILAQLRNHDQEVQFPYEMALIGLAVAAETVPEKWAHEYLSGLAELRTKRIPMAWRIAEICLGNKC